MGAEKLTRTSYLEPDGDPRDGATALSESRRDVEKHLLPLLQVHASTLHGWGIADGLQVSATPTDAIVTVAPGVAVDDLGRHISLAPGSRALLGSGAGAVLIEVTATGASLDLAALTPRPSPGQHYLTLAFAETFDEDTHAGSGFTIFELDHTPRLDLHPDPPDTGRVLILARITIGADDALTDLDTHRRRVLTTPTGGLTVHHPVRTPPDPDNSQPRTVSHQPAGHLTPHPTGGLTLHPDRPDQPLHLGGTPDTPAPLTIDAATITAHRPDGTPALKLDLTDGAATLAVTSLTASTVSTGTLTATDLAAGNLTATTNLTTPTLTATDLSTTNLTTGTLTAGSLNTSSLSASTLATPWLDAGQLNTSGQSWLNGQVVAGANTFVNGQFIAQDQAFLQRDAFVKAQLVVDGQFTAKGDSWLNGQVVAGGTTFVQGQFVAEQTAFFKGEVWVTGPLHKPGGGFLIDHPLAPQDKYLSHSFVESPDMVNLYSGVVQTGDDGRATVSLPDFFEALNRDHRFQLTTIGALALATVEGEVTDNTFTIRTDKPGITVSWQVTGVRQDPWAEDNRIVVEQDKPVDAQGRFLHPELYGHADDRYLLTATAQQAPAAQQSTPTPSAPTPDSRQSAHDSHPPAPSPQPESGPPSDS